MQYAAQSRISKFGALQLGLVNGCHVAISTVTRKSDLAKSPWGRVRLKEDVCHSTLTEHESASAREDYLRDVPSPEKTVSMYDEDASGSRTINARGVQACMQPQCKR